MEALRAVLEGARWARSPPCRPEWGTVPGYPVPLFRDAGLVETERGASGCLGPLGTFCATLWAGSVRLFTSTHTEGSCMGGYCTSYSNTVTTGFVFPLP